MRYLEDFTYVDFDLPEVVSIAAYYLMMAYPNKRILLYGEKEYDSTLHKNYDLIFMPSWEIENAGDCSIDLFINRVSLGEMTKEAVCNYVKFICRSTKRFFFHMNHDGRLSRYRYTDGRGPLAHEYPIPPEQFSLLFRYPDLGHIMRQGFIDFDEDVFVHLYEKLYRKHKGFSSS